MQHNPFMKISKWSSANSREKWYFKTQKIIYYHLTYLVPLICIDFHTGILKELIVFHSCGCCLIHQIFWAPKWALYQPPAEGIHIFTRSARAMDGFRNLPDVSTAYWEFIDSFPHLFSLGSLLELHHAIRHKPTKYFKSLSEELTDLLNRPHKWWMKGSSWQFRIRQEITARLKTDLPLSFVSGCKSRSATQSSF